MPRNLPSLQELEVGRGGQALGQESLSAHGLASGLAVGFFSSSSSSVLYLERPQVKWKLRSGISLRIGGKNTLWGSSPICQPDI